MQPRSSRAQACAGEEGAHSRGTVFSSTRRTPPHPCPLAAPLRRALYQHTVALRQCLCCLTPTPIPLQCMYAAWCREQCSICFACTTHSRHTVDTMYHATPCRSEKKVLNEVNHAKDPQALRYHVTAAKEGTKIKERISLPAEKLFILVGAAHTVTAQTPQCGCMRTCSIDCGLRALQSARLLRAQCLHGWHLAVCVC